VLLLLGGVILYFSFYARDFDLDASADSLLLENDKDLRQYRDMTNRYGSSEFLFVAFAPKDDLFSEHARATIAAMRDDFRKVGMIDSVTSLVDVPLLKQAEGKLSDVAKNYRTLTAADIDLAKAKEELLNSPLFNELIVSKDGAVTAMMLTLKNDPEYQDLSRRRNELILDKYESGLTDEAKLELERVTAAYDAAKDRYDVAIHETIKEIRTIMDRYRGEGDLYLGGVPMIADDMITFVKNDLAVFGSCIFVFLVGMLFIIFREVRWVVLPLGACLLAVWFMIGLLGFTGWRVTVISSNFISLMLIITISMNIHLAVRYRQLRWDCQDLDQKQLVSQTVRMMFWPCFYTATTTMVGFGSLVTSNIKPVIDFGWMMTVGLGVTLVLSFLLFPAVLVMLGKSAGSDTENSKVPFTAMLARFSERHGSVIIAAAVVLTIITAIGVSRLRVENSFVNYFSEDTEIHRGLKLIDDKLGGTTSLDIVVKFPEADPEDPAAEDTDEFDELFGEIEVDKADYWFSPEKIDLIKGIHDYLEGLPAVGKVRSLASTIRIAEDLAHGQEFDTFELAVINKRLPEALRAEMLTPYISIEHDEARINLRVKDSLKDLRRKELLERIRSDLEGKFGLTPDNMQISGLLVLYNNMLQSLYQSQIMTLGIVILGIWLMLLVLFRSLSLSIIGIIPNILSALIILGLMGLLGIPLDMMTIMISSITLGIAVDNSIHYIYRFRQEFDRHGRDYVKTLHYCHASIGRGIFYTVITIIVGFSILVLSNFIPTISFGLLTALAMLIALIAALTLLPKLILMWRPF
jgi:predicted RND superfamily exporter protein